MHSSTILSSLALAAGPVLAAPLNSALPYRATYPTNLTTTTSSSTPLNVVYWGQNGGGTIENNDLSTYCTSTSGIDVLVLAFLYEYGNGNNIASGTIGQSCYISPQGKPQECDDLATAIGTCKAAGVKILLSLGGASGAYSLQSQSQAETIGQNLWDAYGAGSSSSVPRPFGNVTVDGWDFDIESNSGNEYYQYMISKLRSNFPSNSSNTYWITGAPQCPIPEPNMGEIIAASQFDYLWIQFYNNPGCSSDNTQSNPIANINFDAWKQNITGTPSANAKINIGMPAAPDGATGTSSGAKYYLDPSQLATLVAQYKNDSAFGGVMMWSAGFSDKNVINGCTYAQQAHKILTTGQTC